MTFFPDMPKIQPIDGETFRLVEDYCAVVTIEAKTHVIVIKAGFTFDGASVPRWLWWLCGSPVEAPRVAVALVHDWLYAAKVTTREEADEIYAALFLAVIARYKWRVAIETAALRRFGESAWNSHGEEDKARAMLLGAFDPPEGIPKKEAV